jgi:hypothetical protein
MAKNGKKKGAAVVEYPERDYVINEAKLKDGFCNYKYEVTKGTGAGDTHNVKGTNIFLDDMRFAFGQLNVHLAVIDEAFKNSGVEIDDINRFHAHELATRYYVDGLKIIGSKDNESIILSGSKYVSTAGGRIDLVTPKIPLDSLSSYPFHAELKAAADAAREEVAQYKEGKYEVPEEDEQDNSKQLRIGDNVDTDNDEFENAQL